MDLFSNILDNIPGVGQVKMVAHQLSGDSEAAERSFERSTKATSCLAGVLGGGLAGGPAGAIAGYVAGGAAGKALVDSAKNNKIK